MDKIIIGAVYYGAIPFLSVIHIVWLSIKDYCNIRMDIILLVAYYGKC